MNYNKVFNILYEGLESLISIFNRYLIEIVESLNANQELLKFECILQVNQLFSFNYTNTFQRLYKQNIKIDFLHGKCGDSQNIVLGLSDLSHEILKNYKAYGFVKYHQKLMKDTDYKFISENEFVNDKLSFWRAPRSYTQQDETDNTVNLTFWGHSLDVSDRNYIEEVFSLNDEKDLRVRVLIYFYNAQAKFSMLANLIHILGNKKVENWMKKGWLKFEPVPNIADINEIQPVKLTNS